MDLVTLALAKKYTDEKVAEGGGVVIDLDKYGIGSALMGLFAQGGGTTTIENVTSELGAKFWDAVPSDINADVLFLMSLDGSNIIVISCLSKAFNIADAKCHSVSFGFVAVSYGTAYMLNAQINRLGDNDAVIVLKVS